MNTTASEIQRRATDLYLRDRRFRVIADSIVAATLNEHGPIDPNRARQAAHDIAQRAVVRLLQQIYEGDAEIIALRAERDAYRRQAEELLATMPPRLTIPIITRGGEQP